MAEGPGMVELGSACGGNFSNRSIVLRHHYEFIERDVLVLMKTGQQNGATGTFLFIFLSK